MALYFRLSDETDIDLLMLEDEIDRYVDNIDLTTTADLSREVERVLSQIPPDRNNTKKRELARALGEGSVQQGMVKDAIIKHHVSTTTFYNRSKSWLHDPDYRRIMETCVKIYRKWDNGRSARELANRRQELTELALEESMAGMRAARIARETVLEMMKRPLEEVEFSEDGKTIIYKPAKWTQDTATRRFEAIARANEIYDRVARLALDMDTDSTRQTIVNEDDPATAGKLEEIERSVMAKLDSLRRPLDDAAVVDSDAADDEQEG